MFVQQNPKTQLKVIEGLFKKANRDGLYSDLMFWYRLKCINTEGYFEDIHSINTPFAKSTNYKKIANLIKLGWLLKKTDGLYLISYSKLFRYFGYNLETKYKLFKIESNIDKLESLVTFNEIRLNLSRQTHTIRRKVKNSLIHKEQMGNIELFSTLSCRGVSSIMGFNGARKGWNLENELQTMGLITIQKRRDRNNLPLSNELTLLYKRKQPAIGN